VHNRAKEAVGMISGNDEGPREKESAQCHADRKQNNRPSSAVAKRSYRHASKNRKRTGKIERNDARRLRLGRDLVERLHDLDFMAERGCEGATTGIEKEGVFAVHIFAGYSPF